MPVTINNSNFSGVSQNHIDRFNELTAQMEQARSRLEGLNNEPSRPVPGKLQAEDLPQQIDARVREYVAETYNQLKESNQLDVLKESAEKLYTYKGGADFEAHSAIKEIAAKFMKKAETHHYGIVLPFVQQLQNGRLQDVEKKYLEMELEQKQLSLDFTSQMISEDQKRHENLMGLKGKTEADFPIGDFSFIADEGSRKNLESAYRAIEKYKKGDALKSIVKDKDGFRFLEQCDNAGLTEAMGEMDKEMGHSGYSMMWTMANIHSLYTMGWDAYAKLWFDGQSVDLKAMTKSDSLGLGENKPQGSAI